MVPFSQLLPDSPCFPIHPNSYSFFLSLIRKQTKNRIKQNKGEKKPKKKCKTHTHNGNHSVAPKTSKAKQTNIMRQRFSKDITEFVSGWLWTTGHRA